MSMSVDTMLRPPNLLINRRNLTKHGGGTLGSCKPPVYPALDPCLRGEMVGMGGNGGITQPGVTTPADKRSALPDHRFRPHQPVERRFVDHVTQCEFGMIVSTEDERGPECSRRGEPPFQRR